MIISDPDLKDLEAALLKEKVASVMGMTPTQSLLVSQKGGLEIGPVSIRTSERQSCPGNTPQVDCNV